MQAPHPRVFGFFFNQAHAKLSRSGVVEHYADIHPFIANQIRSVADDVIGERIRVHFSHISSPINIVHLQFGKGWRDESRACSSCARTCGRRRSSRSSNAYSASISKPYHSGGIFFAASSRSSVEICFSRRVIQRSKELIAKTDL